MLNSLIIIPILIVIYAILLRKRISKKQGVLNYFFFTCFFIYLFLVLTITIFPLPVDSRMIRDFQDIASSNNYIPFSSLLELIRTGDSIIIIRNIIGNIIMFMPFGFLLPIILKKVNNFKKIITFSFIFSLGIEVLQFLISSITYNYKITDIDDIILNVLGGILGFIIFKISLIVFNKGISIQN